MMTLTGTVKNGGAYDVKSAKDGSIKILISFNVADEIGNVYACQMWPDDPQHAQLVPVIQSMRYQPVTLMVKSYTSRIRKPKEGEKGEDRPQTNFIVSNVAFPQLEAQNAQAAAPGATSR